MSMSRKHYRALADAVGKQIGALDPEDSSDDLAERVIEAMCDVFRDDNPRFDRATFKIAVDEAAKTEKWLLSLPLEAQIAERSQC